ncbi:MAG: PQQ-binding-like beta-propeller repeat protein [Opitutaceae bacterium]|nr:PQQ-binding-like beta-propeller repeat protein [Opitutaceae bacterium]
MRTPFPLVWLVVVLSAFAGLASGAEKGRISPRRFSEEEKAQGFSNRAVLALPKDQMSEPFLVAAEAREKVRLTRQFPRFKGLRVIEVPDGETVDRTISQLQETGLYEYVEHDRLLRAHAIPSDPEFLSGAQWSLRNTGQSNGKAGADIHAVEGWDVATDALGVIVAVIDSGIYPDHPDIAANLWRNPGESGNGRENNGMDDDGNGYIDDVFGIDSTVARGQPGGGSPLDDDGFGHGTAVAGVIGAVGNNGIGIAGVAWKARIMALKFITSDGFGATSDAIECMDYAVTMGAKVINASYGTSTYSAAEEAAIQRIKNAGIVMVTSSGNKGLNNDEFPTYPANHAFENLVAVGASTRTDEPASFSNYGSGKVDLFAPGVDIRVLTRNQAEPYTVTLGTSFSAPHVAGAAALLRSLHPEDTPRATINRLMRGVDRMESLAGKAQSGGRLNLARALTADSSPFNDQFADAAILSGGFVRVRTANNGASKEAGEPAHAGIPASRSLWWTWTAPETMHIAIDTAGSLIDTAVAVYTGSQIGALAEVASNDNIGGQATSLVEFSGTKGTTYRIAVEGKGGQEGMILLNLRAPPSNDDFASALEMTGPSFRTTQSNIGATLQTGEPRIENMVGGRSVWFRWTAPQDGQFQASVTSDVLDTLLGVYQGSSVTALTLVGQDDDAPGSFYDPMVTFQTKAGETYFFAIDSLGDGGKFDFWLVDSEWQEFSYGALEAPPAAGSDGTIYFSSGFGTLEAMSTGGQWLWGFFLSSDGTYSSPAVASDGTIYIGDGSGTLQAFTSKGTKLWSRDLGDALESSPIVSLDGTVYARAEGGDLHAIAKDGEIKWSLPVAGVSYCSPGMGPDGTLYIGSTDHKLYALTSDKIVRWTFDAGDEIYASPAIDAQGNVYFGALNGDFFSVKPDGSQRWIYRSGSGISSSPALGVDGTLYFGTYDGKLHAVGSDGVQRWTTQVGSEIRTSSPAIDTAGVIYIGTLDGKLVAVNPDGSIKRTYHFGGGVRSSPLLHNGMLYVGAQDGRLYAIRTNTDPAASPWPMFRRNSARTGAYEVVPPVLVAQPKSQRLSTGSSATLAVDVNGSAPFTYQWSKDGVAIPGETGATLVLGRTQVSQTGIYSVTVRNGLATVTSDGAIVVIEETPPIPGSATRMINLSVRAVAGQGDKTLIVGFVVNGGAKSLLARAIGPSLLPYGVQDFLPDPEIALVSGSQIVGRNDNWAAGDSTVFSSVGAFPLLDASKDAALVTPVLPGAYSAHVKTNASGVALVELYDLDGPIMNGGPRLINVSARADVGTGGNILIAGFVIAGDAKKRILVRAIGPQLKEFGVGGVLEDPQIELYKGETLLASNDNWTTDDGNGSGAFRLTPGGKDSVLILELGAGSYTANVSGVGGTTGVALVEVYEW